jgi:hypothetical protein
MMLLLLCVPYGSRLSQFPFLRFLVLGKAWRKWKQKSDKVKMAVITALAFFWLLLI